jgi:arylformamidase
MRLHFLLAATILLTLPHASGVAATTQVAYGAAPLQTLDFWAAPIGPRAPLIVFVHGGGWKRGDKDNATGPEKVAHFTGAGYAFASINYRLVPGATVEQQAADVAAALAWLKGHAATLGFDPARIVLMGHSAGAHLVALVGTDPRYLAAAGLTLADLRGVIALDGAAYDVARQADAAGPLMRRTYAEAFGSDPVRQRALSPTLQAAAPNAPAFLLLHVDRDDGKVQAEGLAAALAQAGTPVDLNNVGGSGLRGHMDLNKSLGSAGAPATALVDDWLRKLLPGR